jgi:hypothetical protein
MHPAWHALRQGYAYNVLFWEIMLSPMKEVTCTKILDIGYVQKLLLAKEKFSMLIWLKLFLVVCNNLG